MKKFQLLLAMIFAAVIVNVTLTSCSDDNDNPESPEKPEKPTTDSDISEFTSPVMADEAARFTITDANSPFSSIELTESGRYVVIPSSYFQYQTAGHTNQKTFFAAASPVISRYGTDGIVTGKYTKAGEGEYILDGFGSLSVIGSSQEACDLIITLGDGTEINVGAQQDEVLATDPNTLALCRSWKFEQFRVRLTLNGTVISDRAASFSNLSSLGTLIGQDMYNFAKDNGYLEDGETLSDYVFEIPQMAEEFIFTKTGSYILILDDQLSVNIWRWNNKDGLEIRYSHNIENIYDPDFSNNVWLTFGGTQLSVYEVTQDGEDGVNMKTETWSILSELK